MNLTDQMDYLRKPDTSKCPPQAWLAGQTALVTGASSGIGQQIAIALGAHGADEDGSSMLNRVFERPVGAKTGHPERVLDYDATCVPESQREHREFTRASRSALPRSSRVNPALSIYAWGLHVADQLIMPNGRVNPIHTEPFKEIA